MKSLERFNNSRGELRGFTIVELLIVIVVIAILAAITIVSYNGITNQAKSAARSGEISQWKKQAELHKTQNGIECPASYVFVYGNPTLGTSDFCVMKYEAKNVGGIATSQAAGTPWVNINQTNAITSAAAACQSCQLLTEAQWMTIAADVLSVKYNWSSGVVGNGYIYSGHNDNSPSSALAANNDDTQGYEGTGNSETTGTNQKRTLVLKSGDTIWDFAGNVWEWTQGVISGANSQPGPEDGWKEYGDVSSWGTIPATGQISTLATIPELSGIAGWSASNGIGRIWSDPTDTGTRAFLRGGSWDYGSNTGVLALHLYHSPSYSYPFVGFRVTR